MFESYYKDFSPFHSIVDIKSSIQINRCISSKNFRSRFISKLILNKEILFVSKNLQSPTKNHKFMSRNFWQKFINKYWQETIYLSISSNESEIYINKLRSNGLSVYKANEYKHFLTEFNKALISGNILVSLNNVTSNNIRLLNNKTYLKYIWHKKLYLSFSYLRNLKNIFTISRHLASQRNKVTYNSLPLFNIINDSNRIIIAESGEQALLNNNLLILLIQHYKNIFLASPKNKKIYTSLFFVNAEDAKEYKRHIENKYLKSSRSNYLKLFISPLYFYYNLLNLSSQNIDFHIIPDLQEISNLVYKYQYYRNIIFFKDQKYGKNYFKGQPIYLIEPVTAKHKFLKEKKLINYSYTNNLKITLKNYKAAFLNYDTAKLAWKKFQEKYHDYILPSEPILQVYNLEDYLGLYISDSSNISKKHQADSNVILVPSLETYMFIRNNLIAKNKYMFKEALKGHLLFIKQLVKRIVWSLTSRQPIN
uniref:Uncharacterized protein n=1 Tax=Sphondylothamnion multifidum TaxID=193186 RepID=A0A4D6WYZ8_9FLOR|nr:hypothetical protein [Sphondylothamnion multifidum]